MGLFSKYAASGFVKQLGENLKDRQEYIRDMTQRKTDYLMQEGLRRRGEVMDARLKFQKATDYLSSRGMDNDKIVALLEDNPDEVVRLANTALAGEQEYGQSVNAEILNGAVKVASDYKGSVTSVSQALDKVFPVFIDTKYKTPEAREKGILSRILETPDEAISRNVYGSPILGETTGADIAGSLGSPVQRRGEMTGKVAVSYKGLGRPTSASEANAIRAAVLDTYEEAYDDRVSSLKGVGAQLAQGKVSEEDAVRVASIIGVEYKDNKTLLTDVQKYLKDLEDSVDGLSGNEKTDALIGIFGPKYAVTMSGGDTSIFTPAFGFSESTITSIKEFGEPKKDEAATTPEALPTDGFESPTATSVDVPTGSEVTVSTLPDQKEKEQTVTEEEVASSVNEAGYEFGQGFLKGIRNTIADVVGWSGRVGYGGANLTLNVVDFLAGAFGVDTPEFIKMSEEWTDEQWAEANKLVAEGFSMDRGK